MKKKFALLHKKFHIESVYGEYKLEGLDIFAHSFTLNKNDRVVATISKKLFSLTDSYGVEIIAEEDHPFLLALVIILDQIIYDQNN